jgi:hypothetical protein
MPGGRGLDLAPNRVTGIEAFLPRPTWKLGISGLDRQFLDDKTQKAWPPSRNESADSYDLK